MRLAADTVLCLVVAVAATPLLAAVLPAVPAHRILLRLFVGLMLVFVAARRAVYLGPSPREAGLAPYPGVTDDLAFGFCAGGFVGLLLLVMYADGAVVGARVPPAAPAILGALATGLAVAVVEEVLFRGVALRVWGPIVSSLVYAAVHFLRPAVRRTGEGLDFLLGLRVLGDLGASLADPIAVLPGTAGLLLFGLALCAVRRSSRSLYIGMGIHAGGVFFLRLFDVLTDHVVAVRPWLWGASYPRPLSGPAGWAGIIAVWLIAEVYVRRRVKRR